MIKLIVDIAIAYNLTLIIYVSGCSVPESFPRWPSPPACARSSSSSMRWWGTVPAGKQR